MTATTILLGARPFKTTSAIPLCERYWFSECESRVGVIQRVCRSRTANATERRRRQRVGALIIFVPGTVPQRSIDLRIACVCRSTRREQFQGHLYRATGIPPAGLGRHWGAVPAAGLRTHGLAEPGPWHRLAVSLTSWNQHDAVRSASCGAVQRRQRWLAATGISEQLRSAVVGWAGAFGEGEFQMPEDLDWLYQARRDQYQRFPAAAVAFPVDGQDVRWTGPLDIASRPARSRPPCGTTGALSSFRFGTRTWWITTAPN
jgi:hypothetical protein